MTSTTKILTNTGLLYGKMIITIFISFYTTRIILNALGINDFGIYNLVAGVVAMLSFLNAAMTVSTQRYLSYHKGGSELGLQKKIFSNSLLLHFILGGILLISVEVLGIFIFDLLNIPPDRMETAKFIYHFIAISVFFTIISVPFVASINSHEDMYWIVIVDIIEVVIKLIIAIFLTYLINMDKLKVYGLMMAVVSLFVLLLHILFSLKKYKETTLNILSHINKPLLKELSSFAGWNLFGSLCGVARNQGLAVILNLFFGTIINAAFGIANQIAGQMNFLSATLLRALNPQIMQSEGKGNRKRMLKLSMSASKFGFLMMAFLAIPIIFEMPSILNFWLNKENVPHNTVIFCELTLIAMLVKQLTVGLQSAVQATGRIKVYQVVVGTSLLLNLPIAYILLKLGFAAYYVVFSTIIIEVVAGVFRIFFLKKIADLSIHEYCINVFLKVLFPIVLSLFVCYGTSYLFSFKYRFILTFILSSLAFIPTIYFVAMESDEKEKIKTLIFKIRT